MRDFTVKDFFKAILDHIVVFVLIPFILSLIHISVHRGGHLQGAHSQGQCRQYHRQRRQHGGGLLHWPRPGAFGAGMRSAGHGLRHLQRHAQPGGLCGKRPGGGASGAGDDPALGGLRRKENKKAPRNRFQGSGPLDFWDGRFCIRGPERNSRRHGRAPEKESPPASAGGREKMPFLLPFQRMRERKGQNAFRMEQEKIAERPRHKITLPVFFVKKAGRQKGGDP